MSILKKKNLIVFSDTCTVKQREKVHDSLLSCNGEVSVPELMHVVGDCKIGRSVITNASQQGTL